MKLSHLLLTLPLILFAGCSTYDLEEKWRPLEQIVERPGSDTWLTTVGTKVYVADLDRWLEKNPPGTVNFDADIAHEHVHAIRQKKEGVSTFLRKYLTHRSYRWKEEQLGWYVTIKTYQRKGFQVNIPGIANSLSKYKPSLGDSAEILKWVEDVVYGRWKPEPGDLPEQYKDL